MRLFIVKFYNKIKILKKNNNKNLANSKEHWFGK